MDVLFAMILGVSGGSVGFWVGWWLRGCVVDAVEQATKEVIGQLVKHEAMGKALLGRVDGSAE